MCHCNYMSSSRIDAVVRARCVLDVVNHLSKLSSFKVRVVCTFSFRSFRFCLRNNVISIILVQLHKLVDKHTYFWMNSTMRLALVVVGSVSLWVSMQWCISTWKSFQIKRTICVVRVRPVVRCRIESNNALFTNRNLNSFKSIQRICDLIFSQFEYCTQSNSDIHLIDKVVFNNTLITSLINDYW